MPALLGYWNFRGLGQVPRLMMEYAGADFTEDRYDPSTEREKWQAAKKQNKHGFAFPNLPYLVDGEVRLTQSSAIIRYLARKHSLAGESESEAQQLDMLYGQLQDLRMSWDLICYAETKDDFAKMKAMLQDSIINNFKMLNEYVGGKKFVLGDRLSYVDFILYDLYTSYMEFDVKMVEGLQNLNTLKERFEKLPQIEHYMKSDRYIKWPLNDDSALFGGR